MTEAEKKIFDIRMKAMRDVRDIVVLKISELEKHPDFDQNNEAYKEINNILNDINNQIMFEYQLAYD